MDVDSDDFIYIVSTYNSNNDGGPFRSVVWQIGRMVEGEGGEVLVILDENKRLASMDGLKVESVAIRETAEDGRQVFVGTDDEYYGGIMRLLPQIP